MLWVTEQVALRESVVSRYLCSIAKTIEERSTYCHHCGTKLKPWDPAIYENGKEVGRQQTDHKWCSGCLNVVYNRLLGEMNVSQEYWA